MFNVGIINQTRSRKDSEIRRRARNNWNNDNLPRVRLSDLADGDYRGRCWPPDGTKNPHGYLDYRQHMVPTEFLVEGVDPKIVPMQCPRSTNWDPQPTHFELDGVPIQCDPTNPPEGAVPQYKERCACCENQDFIFGPLDPDDPDSISVYETLEGSAGLQEIVREMMFESCWASTIAIPVSLCARVLSRTKRENSKYDDIVYCPAPNELMGALLQFRQPDNSTKVDEQTGQIVRIKNGFPEIFFDWLRNCPDLNDPITGRWFTLSKRNDGKGVGGYSIVFDPNPSTFDASQYVDYKKLYSFMEWGKGGKTKPSIRLPYDRQIDIIRNAKWADAFLEAGIPITDAEFEHYCNGGDLRQFVGGNAGPVGAVPVVPGMQMPANYAGMQPSNPNGGGFSPAPAPQPAAPTAYGQTPVAPPMVSGFPSNPMGNQYVTSAPAPATSYHQPSTVPSFPSAIAAPPGYNHLPQGHVPS